MKRAAGCLCKAPFQEMLFCRDYGTTGIDPTVYPHQYWPLHRAVRGLSSAFDDGQCGDRPDVLGGATRCSGWPEPAGENRLEHRLKLR